MLVMTEQEARAARLSIIYFLPKELSYNLKEDAAQEILIDMLRTGQRIVNRQYVYWRWIDFTRRLLGRSTTRTWTMPNVRSIETFVREKTFDIPTSHKGFKQIDARDFVEFIMKKIKPESRALIWLYFGQGWKQERIARSFGVSESSISLRLRNLRPLLENLREHYKEALT